MPILITILSVAIDLDKIVLLLINHDSDNKFLDPMMIALTNPYTWVPLCAFLLWYSMNRMRSNAVHFILLCIVVVTITDLTCHRMLQPLFERLSPCNDPGLSGLLRTLVDCGGAYSFPSGYAANYFGLATFCFFYINDVKGKKWHWLWVWAASFGYAQIYVGRHFPVDMIAGAIVGILAGLLIFYVRKYIHLPSLPMKAEI